MSPYTIMSDTEIIPTSKKRKFVDIETDSDDSREDNSTINSPDFWFNDGNLILEVENTRYRVHRNVLSRHSSVFFDMLKLPKAETKKEEAEEEEDGNAQVVHLHDAKEDWEHFLGILYDPFKAFDGWKEYPIEGIVAMLRLGHKYQFDKLKKIAKQRMTQVFPTRNPKWKVTKMFYSVGGWTNEDLQLLDSGLAYDTLTLFRETGLHCVLPAAYLFCVWNSDDLSTIFSGRKRKDGTLSILSVSDQQRIIIGRERLIDESLAILNKYLSDATYIPTEKCTGGSCAKIRSKLLKKYFPTALRAFVKSEMFNPSRSRDEEREFCRECRTCFSVFLKKRREQLWTKLPLIFDLPPWDQLTE